jgi:hypothetical protein
MGGTEVVEAEVISARQAAPESDLDMLFALTAEAASQEAGGRAELIDLGGDDIVLLDD